MRSTKRKVGSYTLTKPNPLMQRATRIVRGVGTFDDRFVPNHDELNELLEQFRKMGCAVALTMGVWDLFHIGHAKYITRGRSDAEQLCPKAERVIMVIGVDVDKLTRERKGPTRPIVPEDERYQVLSYLRAVDIVTPQYEKDTLYKIVMPDVRIVSMSTKDLPDFESLKEYCGHLVNLEPQADTSTSARIRRVAIDGASELGDLVQKTITGYFKGDD